MAAAAFRDASALDEYDQHGRIRGAPPDQAMDQAVYAYVASYLAGRGVLLMVPGEGPVWGDLGKTFPGWQASGRDAILQPPKPQIIPSAGILQLAAEHDTEPDREAAD